MLGDRSCDEGYADFYHEEYVLARLERQERREAQMSKLNAIRVTKALSQLAASEIAEKSFQDEEKALSQRALKVSLDIYSHIIPTDLSPLMIEKMVEKLGSGWFVHRNKLTVTLGGRAPHNKLPVLSFECLWQKSKPLPCRAQYGNYDLPDFGQTPIQIEIYNEAARICEARKELKDKREVIEAQTKAFLAQFHTFNQVLEEWPDLKKLLSADTLRKIEPTEKMKLPAVATESFIETLAKAGVPPKETLAA